MWTVKGGGVGGDKSRKMVHVIGVNWSMLGGRGGQKSPKNGPHGLRMPPCVCVCDEPHQYLYCFNNSIVLYVFTIRVPLLLEKLGINLST